MEDEIAVRSLKTLQEMEQVEVLQRLIWSGSETDIVPSHLTLAIARNGGIVLGALEGERVVGFVLGFLGINERCPGRVAMARLKHVSHQMGVHPAYQNRGLGYRLKLAQRELALDQGIRLITLTYDPLLSLNAHLNIRRLGAVCGSYVLDAYGSMRDGINLGLPSDRFQVDWWVTSTRVITLLEGKRRSLDLAHYLSAGAQELNPASLGPHDLLHPAERLLPPEGNLALVEIPSDFQHLKEKDINCVQAWRLQTRDIFQRTFTAGFIVTDFLYIKSEHPPRSYYVLSLGEGMLR